MLPIQLDMITVAAVDISTTALLGFLLVFAWLQNRTIRSLGWWGAAHLILSASIAILGGAQAMQNPALANVGLAGMMFSYGLMWTAARVFEGREPQRVLVLAGPCGWFAFSLTDIAKSSDIELVASALLQASYTFGAAYEYWRGRLEPLISRWPAILLLLVSGAGYLSWIPMTMLMPISASPSGSVFTSAWFPAVILVTLLGRVALAFIVIEMAKERLELRQRKMALTDALTGLPNRRAFFRQAARRIRPGGGERKPISVLIFDLDHFKQINDRYGHAAGDRVLQSFAETLQENIKATDVVGRMGGEEFAALLFDANLDAGLAAGERVRAKFKATPVEVDGMAVSATVSVGIAAELTAACNLHALLEKADVALYAAKEGGRDRAKAYAAPASAPASPGGLFASLGSALRRQEAAH